MEWLLTYQIKAVLLSAVFFAVYYLFMRNDTYFGLQRFYLIFSVVNSLILPLIPLSLNGSAAEAIGNSIVLQTVNVTADGVNQVYSTNQQLGFWILFIYLIPVVLLLSKMVLGLFRIRRILKQPSSEFVSGHKVVNIPASVSPFSFFNVIGVSQQLNPDERTKILKHELVHVRQLHSFDVLLFEVLSVFLWFNPLIWMFRRAIREVHEFLADEGALKEQVETDSYRLLLFEMCTGKPIHSIPNSFNNSLIKKRLIMMKTPKSGVWSALKPAIAIPMVAMVLVLFACGNASKKQGDSSNSDTVTKAPEKPQGTDSVYNFEAVEKQPVFGNSDDALVQYIAGNVKYPVEAKEKGIQGKVFVSFVIDENGKVTNVAIKQGANELLDKEAVRVISSMPAWKPGETGGKPVKVSYVIPINFKLQ